MNQVTAQDIKRIANPRVREALAGLCITWGNRDGDFDDLADPELFDDLTPNERFTKEQEGLAVDFS